MDNTKGLIVATVAILMATEFVKQASGKGNVTVRSYLGASFVGIFLTGMGMADEQLARNFAMLIILGVLLKDGTTVFGFAANATKKTTGPAPGVQTLRASHGG